MRGQILGFDPMRGEGMISGEDGNRYSFAGAEWKGAPHQLQSGASVDFSPSGQHAVAIYAASAPGFGGPGHGAPPYGGQPFGQEQKSPIVAGLLALFLGSFGVHKFYLGYNAQGAILLGGWFVSLLFTLLLIGVIGLMAIGIIAFVEAIIYLTKSPEQFNYIYVQNKRPWF